MKLDLADALGVLGLLLLLAAVGATWGLWAVVGMFGGLLMTVAFVMAWRNGAKLE